MIYSINELNSIMRLIVQTYGPELEIAALEILDECTDFFDIQEGVWQKQLHRSILTVEHLLGHRVTAPLVCACTPPHCTPSHCTVLGK